MTVSVTLLGVVGLHACYVLRQITITTTLGFLHALAFSRCIRPHWPAVAIAYSKSEKAAWMKERLQQERARSNQTDNDAINHWRKGVAVYKARSTRWTFTTEMRVLLFNKITKIIVSYQQLLVSGQRRLRQSVLPRKAAMLARSWGS